MNHGMIIGTGLLPIKPERNQDVHDVLDDQYVPTTTAEKDLFQEKQKFLFAILESKLKLQREKQSSESMKAHLMPKRHMLNYKNITSSLARHHLILLKS
jgi:hypothetical protein